LGGREGETAQPFFWLSFTPPAEQIFLKDPIKTHVHKHKRERERERQRENGILEPGSITEGSSLTQFSSFSQSKSQQKK